MLWSWNISGSVYDFCLKYTKSAFSLHAANVAKCLCCSSSVMIVGRAEDREQLWILPSAQPGSKSDLWETFTDGEALLSDGYRNIIGLQFTDWPQVSRGLTRLISWFSQKVPGIQMKESSRAIRGYTDVRRKTCFGRRYPSTDRTLHHHREKQPREMRLLNLGKIGKTSIHKIGVFFF